MKKKLRGLKCVWCSFWCQVVNSLQAPFDDDSCNSRQRGVSQSPMHKNMKSYSEQRNRIAKSEFGVNFHSVLFGERAGWRRYPARASYSLEKEERARASIVLAATVNAGIQRRLTECGGSFPRTRMPVHKERSAEADRKKANLYSHGRSGVSDATASWSPGSKTAADWE